MLQMIGEQRKVLPAENEALSALPVTTLPLAPSQAVLYLLAFLCSRKALDDSHRMFVEIANLRCLLELSGSCNRIEAAGLPAPQLGCLCSRGSRTPRAVMRNRSLVAAPAHRTRIHR
jgi:hypothetical protein